MSWICKIIACFIFCISLWLAGLVWFILQIPSAPAGPVEKTDAIIALTGGSGRIEYGLQLLTEDKAKIIFISGVSSGVTVKDLARQLPPDLREKLLLLPQGSIVLGHSAQNTIGNAEETARWLRDAKIHSIRLITSSYHMPRSISEFRNVLPGVDILPGPVFNEEFSVTWWRQKESVKLLLLEYHKFLAGKLRHWIVSIWQTP